MPTIQNMKNIIFPALLALIVSLPSCQLYENGPAISFASREARVSNSWQSTLIARNDIDETSKYSEYALEFAESGTFTWSFSKDSTSTFALGGNWELTSADQQIKLVYVADSTAEDQLLYMDITRLAREELWLDYFLEGDYYSLRLVPR